MNKFKRTLSVLLALVMAFSVMTVAFTVTGSAAPTVVRTAEENPSVVFKVPQFLEAYGTNYYARGTNIKAGGTIFLQVSGASNVSLSCSDSAIAFSDYTMGTDSYTWQMQGGALETTPSAKTVVKWTVTYKVGGKTYKTEAWSAVKLAFGNPGFAADISKKGWAATHKTNNDHVEWAEPLYGNYAGSSDYNCIIDMASANRIDSTETSVAGSVFAGYYFSGEHGQDYTVPTHATGSMFVDTSKYTNLSQTGLQFKATPATWRDTDSNHPQFYIGTSMKSQTVNGATSTAYSVTNSGSGSTKIGGGTYVVDTFSGPLTSNSTVQLQATLEWEGNVTGMTSYHVNTICYYDLTITVYNKSALLASINAANAGNYQQKQMLDVVPSDGGDYTNFRTWSEYYAALQQAWYIYGREDVKQADIDNAKAVLDACIPVYENGQWVKGMMFGPADYTAADEIAKLIPTDFYTNYTDGTNGKLYKYSLASKVSDAVADIAYDRPLDSRYQLVVDTMKQNLSASIANLDGQYKSATVMFLSNGDNVTNVPASISTILFGAASKPSDPIRPNYKFNGWYYDEACTQAVTWPLSININSPYFQGDLNSKNDTVGTAFALYAGWTLTGKKLSFVTNGDTTIEPIVGTVGEAYTGPETTPTKAGYSFVCWCSDITLQNPVDWTTFTFGKYDTVYGKWEKAPFTVTFDANGGKFANGTGYASYTALYGDSVVAPEAPSRTGYGFVGWFYDKALTQQVSFSSFTIPSSNVTVYAKWSDAVRTITFNANGGSETKTVTYEIGAVIAEPVSPSRAGYSFNGWYRDEALTVKVVFDANFKMAADNMTVYASWNPLKYTITFSAGEGQMADSFVASDYYDLDCGSVIVPPENPTREGYVFKGWALDGEPYTLLVVPAQSLNLTAIWEVEPYTVRYRLGTDRTGSVAQGDVITATVYMSANYIVSNNTFIVYYDKRYLQPALNGEPLTAAVTGVNAASKEAGKAYFTVIDNGVPNVTDCSNTITGRVNSCKSGINLYYPSAWQENKALLDDYANYEYVYFNLAENNNGKDRVMPKQEQAIASFQFIVRDDAPLADGTTEYAQLLMPQEFTREADSRLGKISAMREDSPTYDAATGYYDATYELVDNDLRFAVEPMVTSTINFVTNSTSMLSPVTEKVGKTIQLPTPTKAYHDFLGWTYTNSESDVDYVNADAFVVPASGITLYAKWAGQSATYYVRHYKQNLTATGWMTGEGEYEEETLTATIGSTVSATPKTYSGFTCTSSDSGVVVGDVDNALVLNLYYIRNSVKVTLNANSGTFANAQQTVELEGKYENVISNPYGDPTRTGYTFKGWKYGNTDYTLSTYPATDITLNAAWTANTYTLSFYLDGSLYTSISGVYGSAVQAPTVSLGENQTFSGWKNSSGAEFSYTTMPAKNESFYGTTGISGYWLTLMVDGTQYDKIAVYANETVTADMVAYNVPTGYSFSGWRTTDSVNGAKATFPMTLSKDTTLYGFTTHERYTITRYYYLDGAFEYFDEVSGYYGDSFELPEDPDFTEYGYGFDGWYTDEAMTQKYVKPDTMAAGDITLYGNVFVLEGTVQFDLNGGEGTAPEAMSAQIGETITLPGGEGFSMKYYKFGGWTLTKGSNVAVTEIDVTDASTVTVYAIWTVNYAMINFSVNNGVGTAPAAVKAEVGETIDLPDGSALTRDGFIFSGWGTTAAATEALTSYTVTATGSKTLYAVWTPASCELVAQDGSTTVIDNENFFIYGLCFQPDEQTLNEQYLKVVGNGHVEYSYVGFIGTGATVQLINDNTGKVEATYTIVIFGDIDGDGLVTNNDIALIKSLSVYSISFDDEPCKRLAADLLADGEINNSDLAIAKALNVNSIQLDQATREQISI